MALIKPPNVKFGDWMAIKDLETDDSYSVMRYNSDTLKIKVQFERNNSYPLYWQELYLKYQIIFQDIDTTSSNSQSNYDWIQTSFEYEGSTAIASFEIELNNFSPIESITLWGRRKNDEDEEDVKSKTYTIQDLVSSNNLKKDIYFNSNHNIGSTNYENIKPKIWSSARGSLIDGSVTEIKGTSEEQSYFSSSWHDGYIAIKPVKINYLGKERYTKVSLGESNGSDTVIPAFKEVFSFYPTEDKWYYFQLDEARILSYPIIKYTIGECDLFHKVRDINIKSLLHISWFSDCIIPSNNLVRKSQEIIELTQDKDSQGNLRFNKTNKHPIYKITQGPVLSGEFRINFLEELCYELEDKKIIDFYIKDAYGNKFEGGKFQYFSNNKILRLHTSPNFFIGRGSYYINEDEEKQKGYTGPIYTFDECRWDICFKAKNVFSQQEEEITFDLFFNQNHNFVFFKEAVEAYFSTEDFTKNDLLIIDESVITGFSDKMKLLEPRILNPYEQIGFCLNLDFIYLPSCYTSGRPSVEEGNCEFLLYEKLTSSEDEQAIFDTNNHSHRCYNPQKGYPFRLNDKSVIEATQSYSTINEGKSLQKIYEFQDPENPDKAPIESLEFTHFLKIGIKGIFHPSRESGHDYETPITEITTVRMGRVLPMKVKTDSVQLSTQKIIYTLNDYGGDLTEKREKTYNKEDNSLSRTGYEYLKIFLVKDSGETFGSIEIGKDPQNIDIFRGYLLEGIKRTVSNFTLFTEEVYETNEKFLEELLKVTSLKGEYHYSYDGMNPYQITTFEIGGFTFLEEGIPSLGIRKGGIIINGEPGTDLESVEGTPKGKYFFDINALDVNDRVRITFPGAKIQGEIYYDGEAIVLKGFKLLS